ncbi:MAG: tetratricopeptide repeat protein, partial [Planctomycetota bacterium]
GGEAIPVAEVDLDNDDLLARQIDAHGEQVRRHPDYADLRYRHGVLLRAQGRHADAEREFAAAVEINPAYAQAQIKLALTRQDLGRTDDAVEAFERALELRPEYVDLHYRLGLLHAEGGDPAAALSHAEAALAGAPDNERMRAFLAVCLQNLGLRDRAAATWRGLWKIHHAKA